jgi:FHS family L-fucose permease-like MFS transporter
MNTPTTNAPAQKGGSSLTMAVVYVTVLFFIWAVITNLLDPLLKTMKTVFTLSPLVAQLTTSAFFIAYGIMSLPAAGFLNKNGYLKSVIVGLGGIVAGCLIALLSTKLKTYPVFLIALFTMASGITLLQVAASPLIASMGDPKLSHFRLNFSQAFNSLGAVCGIFFGSTFLFTGDAFKEGVVMTDALKDQALGAVGNIYLLLGVVLTVFIGLFWMVRKTIDDNAPHAAEATSPMLALKSKWANLGSLAIFFYVGAEVAIGSTLVVFLEQKHIMGLETAAAGKLTALYMLFAMIGRFGGSSLLRLFKGYSMLALAAIGAMALCAVVLVTNGQATTALGYDVSIPLPAPFGPISVPMLSTSFIGFAALLVGLFNSIMFPTIFTTTLERSTAPASATSGLMCVAISGGAFVPLLFAKVNEMTGTMNYAYIVPLLCYAYIFWFARAAKSAPTHQIDEGVASGH